LLPTSEQEKTPEPKAMIFLGPSGNDEIAASKRPFQVAGSNGTR
jgi:hypothetical protein